MIIRVNFSDNDFGIYFEEYFKQFKFTNYYMNLKPLETSEREVDIKNYRDKRVDMEGLYKKIMFEADKVTNKEKIRFVKYVRESIMEFLKNITDIDTFEYLDACVDVTLRKTYIDEWENGETIYYIIGQDKYILQ